MSVVYGATHHTQKNDVERNGGSLENVAEIFVLLLCSIHLVLRSGVFTILDLDEVDVTPSFAEVFRSVLSGVGGSTGWWLAVLLGCSQSPCQDTKKKYTKAYAEGCTQILKTTDCYFFGQVEQKGSSYLRHAETKKDNLSIPCAYRCLEYLPPFTFQC